MKFVKPWCCEQDLPRRVRHGICEISASSRRAAVDTRFRSSSRDTPIASSRTRPSCRVAPAQRALRFWDRDTMWRYHTAAAIGDITVIALWDGKEGAAAKTSVRMAKERGAKDHGPDA